MNIQCTKPRDGTAAAHSPNQSFYDPSHLPLADNKLLDEMCRAGQISEADAVAAKWRRSAVWSSDRKSVRYRELAKQGDDDGSARAEVEAMQDVIARVNMVEQRLKRGGL